jgi:hypothetical protein
MIALTDGILSESKTAYSWTKAPVSMWRHWTSGWWRRNIEPNPPCPESTQNVGADD